MIEVKNWGRDHWSTLAYLGTLAVDNKGIAIPDRRRMRTNEITHPHLVGHDFGNQGANKYPTILKEGTQEGHDDWDCIDDSIQLGFLEEVGTGFHRAYKFTKKGLDALHKLSDHKINGGNYSQFVYSEA